MSSTKSKPRQRVETFASIRAHVKRVEGKISDLDKTLTALTSGQKMLSERVESLRLTMAPVIGHCERLMREKETLRKLYEANRFMAQSLPYRCAKTHRMGRKCEFCGETPT